MGDTQPEASFHLAHCAWPKDGPALSAVRCAVFVDEQGVPESLELDEYDTVSHHVLVRDRTGKPVGAGRIKPDGQIGRMAVLKDWRGRGIGSAMLAALLEHARRQRHTRVFLHAQSSALSFYERAGFTVDGPVFEAAGILHRCMVKTLE